MTDFSDTNLMLARGKYATARAEHEEAKKRLSVLCGQLSSSASLILRALQPDDNETVGVDALINSARSVLDDIEKTAEQINLLAELRGKLKPEAWGKK